MGLCGFGKVEDFDAPGLPLPELLKGFYFVLDVLNVTSSFPGKVNMKTFPVVHPTGPGFVNAAAERELVPLEVGDNSHLLVVDASNRDGLTLPVGWHCDLNVKRLIRHHPGQGF